MTALEVAAATLRAEGYLCAPGAASDGAQAKAGGLVFCGPLGHGRIDAGADGRVWLRYDVSAAAGDPVTLARIASRTGPARITLRRRAPVAEQLCAAADIGAALRAMVQLRAPQGGEALPLVDVAVGVLCTAAPALSSPTFLRLVPACVDTIDCARATYLLVANAQLRAATGGWLDGGGLAVDPQTADPALLARELSVVGQALDALADAAIARSYLDLNGMKLSGPTRAPRGAP